MTQLSMLASISTTNGKSPASSTGALYPARYGRGTSTLSFIHRQMPMVRGSKGTGDLSPGSVASASPPTP
eukprot:4233745-Alexandrium_andersonii.AAC.1